MKTAKEWDAKSQLTINKNCEEYRLAIYRECQLDAMKAGFRIAAQVPNEMRGEGESDLRCVRDRILSAADELTEKDL